MKTVTLEKHEADMICFLIKEEIRTLAIHIGVFGYREEETRKREQEINKWKCILNTMEH